MAGALEGDAFIGDKAQEHRGLLKLTYPTTHGIVTNWDDMERIWQFLFAHDLNVKSEEHPVLLTEPPLNPKSNRQRAAEILFETFNSPALHVSIQAVLSLYASGKTTGLVLDCGDGVSHAVPIYEGFAVNSATQRIDIAGRDVTERLQLLLRQEGTLLLTSAEKEIVRKIKESHCYVSLDPKSEAKSWPYLLPRTNDGSRPKDLDDKSAPPAEITGPAIYVLPDGKEIQLGSERYLCNEVLFAPDLIGSECPSVPQIVLDAIARSDTDLRPALYSNIVLSGGTTLFKGFGGRLLAEIKKGKPKYSKIRIVAPQERKYSTWLGGSILAHLSTFKNILVTYEDWQENPDLIHVRNY